jgi:hypothetical protein
LKSNPEQQQSKTMPAKVFISCGQRPGREREAAQKIKDWFEKEGYFGYVATEVQMLC